MSRVSSLSNKKWMLCAAAGFTLGPMIGFGLYAPLPWPATLQADETAPTFVDVPAEPGRIDPAIATEPLAMDAEYPGSYIQQTQGTVPAQQSQSDIMRQLEALYAKDGREMPAMALPPAGAAAPQPSQQLQPSQQMQQSQQMPQGMPYGQVPQEEPEDDEPSKWNLFDRLFRRNRAEPRPQPIRPSATAMPQYQVRPPVRQNAPAAPQTFQPAGTAVRIAVQPQQPLQQQVQSPQQFPVQQQLQIQQQAQPRQLQPQYQQPIQQQVQAPLQPAASVPQQFMQSAQPVTGSGPESESAAVRISDATTQAEVEAFLDDALDNPFPEVSEAEADLSSANPFSGMRLETEVPVAVTPSANATPRIDFGDEPAPPLPDGVPQMPLGSTAGQIAPAKAEVPQLELSTVSVSDIDKKMQMIMSRATLSGLKGFCIVSLRDHRQLRDAKPEHQTIYNEQIFQFSSAEAKATFERSPEIYVPASGGIDVVIHGDNRVRVDGSLDHAAWFRGRLYLFTTPETLAAFEAAPAKYAVR